MKQSAANETTVTVDLSKTLAIATRPSALPFWMLHCEYIWHLTNPDFLTRSNWHGFTLCHSWLQPQTSTWISMVSIQNQNKGNNWPINNMRPKSSRWAYTFNAMHVQELKPLQLIDLMSISLPFKWTTSELIFSFLNTYLDGLFDGSLQLRRVLPFLSSAFFEVSKKKQESTCSISILFQSSPCINHKK